MNGQPQHLATSDDLHRILGKLEAPRVVEILDLAPTVTDVEEAVSCLVGDDDSIAGKAPCDSVVARKIVEILIAADEADEHLREP